MIAIDKAKALIGQRVVIASQSGALYEGDLSHVNAKKNKLVLTRLIIRGRHDGLIASKRDRSRWFNLTTFSLHSTDKKDMAAL